MIQARPWVSPEVLFNFGRPELSPWIKFGYFFLYQTFAIFSIMKILDNVCPFSFLWAHHRANHVLRQLMEWDVSRENIQPRTSFTLRSVRVNISKCLKIILDCRKSGRRAGKHIVPSFLIFQTNTKTKIGMFFLQFDNAFDTDLRYFYCWYCLFKNQFIWTPRGRNYCGELVMKTPRKKHKIQRDRLSMLAAPI